MTKTKSFVLCILYSEVLALWSGAALGTLNWLLFALLPLGGAGLFIASRAEEAMLRSGQPNEAYAAQTGRFIPKVWVRQQTLRGQLRPRTHRWTVKEIAPCWRRARLTWLCRREEPRAFGW